MEETFSIQAGKNAAIITTWAVWKAKRGVYVSVLEDLWMEYSSNIRAMRVQRSAFFMNCLRDFRYSNPEPPKYKRYTHQPKVK
jgi:hypothetical protein